MLLAVFDRAALMLICLSFSSVSACFANCCTSRRTPQRIARRYRHFLAVRPVQHLVGVPVEGSLVNVRIIAVMSGGFCLARG